MPTLNKSNKKVSNKYNNYDCFLGLYHCPKSGKEKKMNKARDVVISSFSQIELKFWMKRISTQDFEDYTFALLTQMEKESNLSSTVDTRRWVSRIVVCLSLYFFPEGLPKKKEDRTENERRVIKTMCEMQKLVLDDYIKKMGGSV